MIDPYAPIPAHNANPINPVELNGKLFCTCDDCRDARQRWADNQPPLIAELDSRDSEDAELAPI